MEEMAVAPEDIPEDIGGGGAGKEARRAAHALRRAEGAARDLRVALNDAEGRDHMALRLQIENAALRTELASLAMRVPLSSPTHASQEVAGEGREGEGEGGMEGGAMAKAAAALKAQEALAATLEARLAAAREKTDAYAARIVALEAQAHAQALQAHQALPHARDSEGRREEETAKEEGTAKEARTALGAGGRRTPELPQCLPSALGVQVRIFRGGQGNPRSVRPYMQERAPPRERVKQRKLQGGS